eukprot:4842134-Pyramimonas_sp.AAC.2
MPFCIFVVANFVLLVGIFYACGFRPKNTILPALPRAPSNENRAPPATPELTARVHQPVTVATTIYE